MKKVIVIILSLALVNAVTTNFIHAAEQDKKASKQTAQDIVDTVIQQAQTDNNHNFKAISNDMQTQIKALVKAGTIMKNPNAYGDMIKTAVKKYKKSCAGACKKQEKSDARAARRSAQANEEAGDTAANSHELDTAANDCANAPANGDGADGANAELLDSDYVIVNDSSN